MLHERTNPSRQGNDRVEPIWQLAGGPADVRVAVGADDGSKAARAEEIVQAEMSRLDQIFSIDDRNSMLNRWIVDPSIRTSNEFDELLSTALAWQRSSRGVFNVSTRKLFDLWERATADGCQPSHGELNELAAEMADAPYRFDGHLLRQTRDCRALDMSAIATGFGIDAATEAAFRRCDLSQITVSAHAKIVHRGSVDIEVDIGALTDRSGVSPRVTLHNAAVTVRLAGQRGASMEGERANLVFDPLTGRRVGDAVSVAVVASDATTADAVATIVRAMTLDHGLTFVNALNAPSRARHPSEFLTGAACGAIQCWILDTQGELHYTGPSRAPE